MESRDPRTRMAAPETAQTASGSPHGRTMMPEMARAAISQMVSWTRLADMAWAGWEAKSAPFHLRATAQSRPRKRRVRSSLAAPGRACLERGGAGPTPQVRAEPAARFPVGRVSPGECAHEE